MKFNAENIRDRSAFPGDVLNKYRPPEIIGAPKGRKERAVADACFKPVKTMLAHALESLGAEGVPVFPGYALLCGLTQNGLIRAGVEMRAKEMTRKWGNVTAADESGDRAGTLSRALEAFNVRDIFRHIAEQCGFMGGCLLYIDFDDELGNPAMPVPLDAKTIQPGAIRSFKILDPWTCYPGFYNSVNPLKDDYFKPSMWYVQGEPVHESRLIRFVENELPNMLKPAYNFFGISLTQKVLEAVSHFTRNRESASKLLEKVSLTVLKTNMENVLSGGGDSDLNARMQYFAQNWDFNGVAAIDKDSEDLVILNNTLSGIVDIVRQSMEYVAAMFNEPATKLWGISPAGMNATGESDMKNHYDNIASLQEQMFTPGLNKILQLLQLNAFGDIDSNIKFTFTPLNEENERAVAEVNKLKADTAAVYEEMGAINAGDVRNAIIKDARSGFSDLVPYSVELQP